uniref:Uncharacterized protein n=1 Tax=Pithovirus LCPAC406 TaxID=2506599 RepID=A0A481ZCS3_9VIRU|nr:MAG: hypothetical protein LCPAC406_00570 [Pithovirus LCPAC406]
MVDWAFRYSGAVIVVVLIYLLVISLVNAFNYSGFKSDKEQNQAPSQSESMLMANVVINGISAILAVVIMVTVFLDH